MDEYCVVVCGLRAGTSDEALAWAPVAAALRMDPAEFERRVVAALPRIVRQDLDQATADRIAQLLQGMQVDARALPDDPQLVYIDRAGSSCGPLPLSALADFIEPGETYRLHGGLEWLLWPTPLDYEPSVADDGFDDALAAAFDDSLADTFAAAPTDGADIGELAQDTSPDDALPDDASPRSMPPQLPPVSAATTTPEAATPDEPTVPMAHGEPAVDDDLIDPPADLLASADPDAVAEAPADAAVAPARRSKAGRLLVLLVIVGLAAWAYEHWIADTHVDDSPPPAAASHTPRVATGATTAPAHAASVVAPAPIAAASTAATSATSTPAPASSAPAPNGTASTPAATLTVAPAPATTSATSPA